MNKERLMERAKKMLIRESELILKGDLRLIKKADEEDLRDILKAKEIDDSMNEYLSYQ